MLGKQGTQCGPMEGLSQWWCLLELGTETKGNYQVSCSLYLCCYIGHLISTHLWSLNRRTYLFIDLMIKAC